MKNIKNLVNMLLIMVVISAASSINVYADWEKNTSDNSWRYSENGQYITGWKLVDSKWYFMNADNKMAANQWILSKDLWYYVGSDGAMLVNSVTPDGYTVDANGVWWNNEDEKRETTEEKREATEKNETTLDNSVVGADGLTDAERYWLDRAKAEPGLSGEGGDHIGGEWN